MIYTALKKFEKALYFYEVVCTSSFWWKQHVIPYTENLWNLGQKQSWIPYEFGSHCSWPYHSFRHHSSSSSIVDKFKFCVCLKQQQALKADLKWSYTLQQQQEIHQVATHHFVNRSNYCMLLTSCLHTALCCGLFSNLT